MTETLILYHNPRCSKSRAALDWLNTHHINIKIIPYLLEPLSEPQIHTLKGKLGIDSVRQMMRTKDDIYQELRLEQTDEAGLIAAIASHPALLERPIAVLGDRAAIGRPLENITKLIEQAHANQ